jgi:hypothetical protein
LPSLCLCLSFSLLYPKNQERRKGKKKKEISQQERWDNGEVDTQILYTIHDLSTKSRYTSNRRYAIRIKEDKEREEKKKTKAVRGVIVISS